MNRVLQQKDLQRLSCLRGELRFNVLWASRAVRRAIITKPKIHD